MKQAVIKFATGRPKTVYAIVVLLTLLTGALMARIQIDTDPENMLAADQADRVFHNAVEDRFTLHDAIVVGVVNDSHPNGVFNAKSLAALHSLSTSILELEGVVTPDLMSLAVVDNIGQEGPGTIRFEWMMRDAPVTDAQALEIRDKVSRLPLLQDTLVSGDGKAAAIYVPIASKDLSYPLSQEIAALTEKLDSSDEFHITGLPVAEDTFGHDMFVQMGISAPLAGLMIFLLMLYFFRSAPLVVAPMLVAMATVIVSMGLMIGLGFTVHIMSSMIPIFLMPIAVVDSVHIMSEFADSYRTEDDAKTVISRVVGHLFTPMLFTSLTSAVGFLSLLLTPIPPGAGFWRLRRVRHTARFRADDRPDSGLYRAHETGVAGQAGVARQDTAYGHAACSCTAPHGPFRDQARQAYYRCRCTLDRRQCRRHRTHRDQRQPGALVQSQSPHSGGGQGA